MFRDRQASGIRRLALGAVAVMAVTAAACGGSSDPDDAAAPDAAAPEPAATPGQVTMRLIAFTPDRLDVKAGTTVTWAQEDPGTHTVTSGTVEQGGAGVTEMPDGRFDSGQVATGARFTFAFDEPGTYPYFCSLHPATMRGEVQVG